MLADDVKVDYVGGTFRWQMEGKANVLRAVAEAFTAQVIACHTGHHPEIEVRTPTTARGTWYLTDTGINLSTKMIMTGSALYQDEYRKIDGAWKIQVSTYQRIYERIEKLPEDVRFTAHYLGRL